jgi:adenylate cyclase
MTNAPETLPVPAAESGVQTFLIADLRGYTRYTLEHGDEAAAAVARRFARRASDVASAHAGRIIEIRGDEALGVFNSPRQALRAAIAIHSPQTSTADDSLPLPIGVGIDSGEAVPVDGGYRGAALNLAARLCSLAGPGEILASDTVARLAHRLDNVRYQERGATLPVGAVVLDRPPSSPGTITMPWR